MVDERGGFSRPPGPLAGEGRIHASAATAGATMVVVDSTSGGAVTGASDGEGHGFVVKLDDLTKNALCLDDIGPGAGRSGSDGNPSSQAPVSDARASGTRLLRSPTTYPGGSPMRRLLAVTTGLGEALVARQPGSTCRPVRSSAKPSAWQWTSGRGRRHRSNEHRHDAHTDLHSHHDPSRSSRPLHPTRTSAPTRAQGHLWNRSEASTEPPEVQLSPVDEASTPPFSGSSCSSVPNRRFLHPNRRSLTGGVSGSLHTAETEPAKSTRSCSTDAGRVIGGTPRRPPARPVGRLPSGPWHSRST